jgi:hypothetical protein
VIRKWETCKLLYTYLARVSGGEGGAPVVSGGNNNPLGSAVLSQALNMAATHPKTSPAVTYTLTRLLCAQSQICVCTDGSAQYVLRIAGDIR